MRKGRNYKKIKLEKKWKFQKNLKFENLQKKNIGVTYLLRKVNNTP